MYYGDFSDFGDFGKKIRAARLKKGLKKKDAAVLIGMYPSYYGYVERSMVLPKYNKLKMACDKLGVSLCYLFSDDNHVVFDLNNYSDEKQKLIKIFSQTFNRLNQEKTIDWSLEDFFYAFKNLKREQRQIIAAFLNEFNKLKEAS